MENLIIALAGFFGIIIGAFLQWFFNEKAAIKQKEREFKEIRYKAIMLLCYGYVNPKEFKFIKNYRLDINSIEDLKNELITEYVNSLLFADEKTIIKFKEFIINPSKINFLNFVKAMRKDTYGTEIKDIKEDDLKIW